MSLIKKDDCSTDQSDFSRIRILDIFLRCLLAVRTSKYLQIRGGVISHSPEALTILLKTSDQSNQSVCYYKDYDRRVDGMLRKTKVTISSRNAFFIDAKNFTIEISELKTDVALQSFYILIMYFSLFVFGMMVHACIPLTGEVNQTNHECALLLFMDPR